MKQRARLLVALVGALAILPGVIAVMARMPTFGAHPLPYGDAINRLAPVERHVTNMVTAVNFDYRGLDTLGEEFMLLGAVTGIVMLLRGPRGEGDDDSSEPVGRAVPPPSEALVLACRLFGPIVLLFGVYVVLHAQLTPGGGFQGGVIIASGTLLLYLGEGYGLWRRFIRSEVFDMVEALGALVFVCAGFGPMIAGAQFLENTLPLGRTKALISGGLILVENAGTALAVAGGFVLLLLEFLEETCAPTADEP